MQNENIGNITRMDSDNMTPEALQPEVKSKPRAMILGAIAAGAFTSAAAATFVLRNIDPEAEAISEIEFADTVGAPLQAEAEAPIEATVVAEHYDIEPRAAAHSHSPEPLEAPQAEPVVATAVQQPDFELAEPKLADSVIPSPDSEEILIEEIDPVDENVDNVFYVDDIGVMYNEEGEAINAASIQFEGENLTLVDLDNDYVFESVYDGNEILKLDSPGPINVSDAEAMYAEQTDNAGYLPANDYDNSLNDLSSDSALNSDILDDIMLS